MLSFSTSVGSALLREFGGPTAVETNSVRVTMSTLPNLIDTKVFDVLSARRESYGTRHYRFHPCLYSRSYNRRHRSVVRIWKAEDDAPTGLTRLLKTPRWNFPPALRKKWVGFALIIFFFWAYERWTIWDMPRRTSAVLPFSLTPCSAERVFVDLSAPSDSSISSAR
jgi:hypothetical protein